MVGDAAMNWLNEHRDRYIERGDRRSDGIVVGGRGRLRLVCCHPAACCALLLSVIDHIDVKIDLDLV